MSIPQPSGNAPTTRVRRRISLMIRSSGWLVRIFCQWMSGKRNRLAFLARSARRGRPQHHPGSAQIVDDSFCLLVGSLLGSPAREWLEHVAHLANLTRRHVAEHIAIEVHHAALALSLGRYSAALSIRPLQASDVINCTPVRPRSTRWPQERRPAGLVLLGAFADAENLAETLGVNGTGDQQRDIAHLARPAAVARQSG